MRPVLIATALALGAPEPGAAQADSAMSTRQGVFTEAQARRGEAVYENTCAQCHLRPYFRDVLLPSWVGAPVSMLYDVVRVSMPEDRPGGLEPQQYADVLAYIFELNGLPPGGRELPTEPAQLARIMIERSP